MRNNFFRKLLLLILCVSLIYIAIFVVNIGNTYFESDGFAGFSEIGYLDKPSPANPHYVALHTSYVSPGTEKYAEMFLRKAADLLQREGLQEVVLLPSQADLQPADRIEGVFVFHFESEFSGWQNSRQGHVAVYSDFVSFKPTTINSLSAGAYIDGTGHGWINDAYFRELMIDEAVECWVQKVGRTLNLTEGVRSSVPTEPRWLEEASEVPDHISALLHEDSDDLAYVSLGQDFILSYVAELDGLEEFLAEKIQEIDSLKVMVPWVDSTAGRRMIQLASEDGSRQVQVFHGLTEKTPYVQGEMSPRTPRGDGHQRLVTIVLTSKQKNN